MNYALVENVVVTNLIWLYPANAAEFPNAVPMGDRGEFIEDCIAEMAMQVYQ